MTYLDDIDHDWSIDTTAERQPMEDLLTDLVEADPSAQRLILQGFIGLTQRHPEASVEDRLLTSLVWYFG